MSSNHRSVNGRTKGQPALELERWKEEPVDDLVVLLSAKPTELVYFGLEDARLARLLEASAATGRTVEELIQESVAEFLEENRCEISVPSGHWD
jgi:hypothetical protein